MIHFERAGESGPWLVFIPGLTCALSDWHLQVAALEGRYRCVSVDLRGHGLSQPLPPPYTIDNDARDLVEVLDHLQASKATLIGHSRGVRVAALTSVIAPNLVGGIVLVDGSQQGHGDPQAAREHINALIDSAGDTTTFSRRMFEAMFLDGTPVGVSEPIVERAAAMPDRIFRALISDLIGWDAEQMLHVFPKVTVPTGVVQSTLIDSERQRRPLHDGEIPAFVAMLRTAIPHAQIELLAGVGHFTQLDAPQAVTAMTEQIAALASSA